MIVVFKAGRSPSTTGRAGPVFAAEFGLRIFGMVDNNYQI
jgi:hypothetical protein